MAKTIACLNCGSDNQADADVCFHCLCPHGTINVYESDGHGGYRATGEVLKGAAAAKHASTVGHKRAQHPTRAVSHPGFLDEGDHSPKMIVPNDSGELSPKDAAKRKASTARARGAKPSKKK